MKAPQPIPYQGSKRALAPLILRYFPNNSTRIVEPFAGSGAISVASALRNKAQSYWLNDLNKPLIDLIQEIVENPESISKKYSKIWNKQLGNEREYYKEIRARFNKTNKPDDFLFILARCVKGAVRYNSKGEFNQSPDNRRKGKRPRNMEKEIFQFSNLLKDKTIFSSYDFKEVLNMVDQEDLVYMDPPYQGTSNKKDSRYLAGLQFNEFVESLEDLNMNEISYIISYDGKLGNKSYGDVLPEFLNLKQILIEVGRSTTSTLLGNDEITYESLYLSPALINRIEITPEKTVALKSSGQLQLL